jgi:hypothetical protein
MFWMMDGKEHDEIIEKVADGLINNIKDDES